MLPPLKPVHIGISVVTLSVHPMYQPNHYICELHHIATTRQWLSSHRLQIETGQWSCTPREENMCSCDEDVQTESHVPVQYPQTAALRLEYNNLNFDSLTSYISNKDLAGMCFYAHKVLSTVTWIIISLQHVICIWSKINYNTFCESNQ